MSRTLSFLIALSAAFAAALFATPSPAAACGGFFCNRQPIDQAGENIVYAVADDGSMETHIQILYQGAAMDFAWILPVPSIPEISVGTDLLFQQLNQATQVQFRTDYETTGTCRPTPSCPSLYPEGPYAGGSYDAGASYADSAAADSGSSVSVYLQESVGPYDAVVLSSTDATALQTWLTDNGYDIPEASVPLMMDYIADGSFFVALKLSQDAGVGEIQPVVLNYMEQKACLPIKLTAIATIPDMPITAYILGAERARPLNYMSTEPDLDSEGFWLGSENYMAAVSRAADDAGGQAFVTEFAGATPSDSFYLGIMEIEDLRTVTDPATFVMNLQSRGFTGDKQLLALLLRFVPPPESIAADPNGFYNCIVNDWCHDYDGYLETLTFDPNAFVDALDAAIVDPRNHAQELVTTYPQLTRLFTTMSAEEMTVDPLFDLDPSVPEVSNIHTAVRVTECSPEYFSFDAPEKLVLPSGREVQLREGIAYRGTDEQYCDDRAGGMYGPGVDPGTALATATARSARLGGGGASCSAAGGASGVGFAIVSGLGLLFFARRRRRS